MKTDSGNLHTRDYVSRLMAKGRYTFTSREAREALGVSADAARLALNRLGRQGWIASPARGFYVIVPPEYQRLGCLPADQFVPALMDSRGSLYYAGLLSAAQYHGAAHQRPQSFQVMVGKPRRAIQCGRIRVEFMVRKGIGDVPTVIRNTPRGSVRVSSVEATAVDLVGYVHQSGGLDQVATILAELAENMEPARLVDAAQTAPLTWAQRLGYLLELVEFSDRADLLRQFVAEHARDNVALMPSLSHSGCSLNRDWKLYINTDVEPDF